MAQEIEISALARGVGTTADGRRLDAAAAVTLPADTWDVAGLLPGSRLEFLAGETELAIKYRSTPPIGAAGSVLTREFSLWRGREHIESFPVADSEEGRLVIRLSGEPGPYRLYLPETGAPEILSLIDSAGTLQPAPRRPVWIAYGDSITQGWSVTDAGMGYVARAGQIANLEDRNFGFAGAARGETQVAVALSRLDADIYSLAFGTNNWTRVPMGSAHLRGVLRDFVHILRTARPDAPIVVISPILRPDAEAVPNVAGATLADLRLAIEEEVAELASRDVRLHLLGGASIVSAEQLVDGIHPGDEGHAALGHAVAEALTVALTGARP